MKKQMKEIQKLIVENTTEVSKSVDKVENSEQINNILLSGIYSQLTIRNLIELERLGNK